MSALSEEIAQTIVEAYERGEKLSAISARLGVPQSTIYWHLEREGITPNRLKRRSRFGVEPELIDNMYAVVKEQEETIAALEAEIVSLRNMLNGHPRAVAD